ncbi:MAG: zinc-dependent peptidase [Chitinophagaceae bacterium]|nr:zinc-dependent peptidase [Chitinophagaceae bacterium]MCB9044988.1 zinc-dependent peptidase [Chitinophagales bacterium]
MLKGIIVSLVIVGIIVTNYLLWKRKQKKLAAYKLPAGTTFLLHSYVPYYRALSAEDKAIFEERMRDFLARTKVTGTGNVVVHDVDLVFIAASAVIPLFGYLNWRYNNLDEVLLYEGTFSKRYELDGPDRNVLGMVGDGVMNREMILSQPALRAGYLYPDNAHNTAIHEFAHLIDKADGATDGVPQYLLDKQSTKEWKSYMQAYIRAIKEGLTDINPYGATSEAEFFAVVSEYYFKQPDHFKSQYPELYNMLHKMYQPKAA